MSVWTMVAMAAGGWCLLSVVAGVIIGHAMAGKPLRGRSAGFSVVAPVAMLGAARPEDLPALDAAV